MQNLAQQLLANQRWLTPAPWPQVHKLCNGPYIIRDDLLHPLLGGNKLRKLDALLPFLQDQGCKHLVTCGGVQSAHTAAVAAAAREAGLQAHLLVRGEAPAVPTGYHLLVRWFGAVHYIPRSLYAQRQKMFDTFIERLHHEQGIPKQQIGVIPEGGAHPLALLGFMRLLHHWASQQLAAEQSPMSNSLCAHAHSVCTPSTTTEQDDSKGISAAVRSGSKRKGGQMNGQEGHVTAQPAELGRSAETGSAALLDVTQPCTLVVDSGTGCTAVGLALGCKLLGIPWHVHGVMLAGSHSYYLQQQVDLLSAFSGFFPEYVSTCQQLLVRSAVQDVGPLPLVWGERLRPRKFGKVFEEDIASCRAVAQQHGIVLDPVYSLAGWELAMQAQGQHDSHPQDMVTHAAASRTANLHEHQVAYLHSGGGLGLFGLAQRHPLWF